MEIEGKDIVSTAQAVSTPSDAPTPSHMKTNQYSNEYQENNNELYEAFENSEYLTFQQGISRNLQLAQRVNDDGNACVFDRWSDCSTGQVTSRGCSRAYIVFVLYRALFYVQNLRAHQLAVFFPFPTHQIESWFEMAQNDCIKSRYNKYNMLLGGTVFTRGDTSTYWTNPQQFFTWWKNNIERKSKFNTLFQDSCYEGCDSKRSERAIYCKVAIAICLNIKFHFERYVRENKGHVEVLPICYDELARESMSDIGIEAPPIGAHNIPNDNGSDYSSSRAQCHLGYEYLTGIVGKIEKRDTVPIMGSETDGSSARPRVSQNQGSISSTVFAQTGKRQRGARRGKRSTMGLKTSYASVQAGYTPSSDASFFPARGGGTLPRGENRNSMNSSNSDSLAWLTRMRNSSTCSSEFRLHKKYQSGHLLNFAPATDYSKFPKFEFGEENMPEYTRGEYGDTQQLPTITNLINGLSDACAHRLLPLQHQFDESQYQPRQCDQSMERIAACTAGSSYLTDHRGSLSEGVDGSGDFKKLRVENWSPGPNIDFHPRSIQGFVETKHDDISHYQSYKPSPQSVVDMNCGLEYGDGMEFVDKMEQHYASDEHQYRGDHNTCPISSTDVKADGANMTPLHESDYGSLNPQGFSGCGSSCGSIFTGSGGSDRCDDLLLIDVIEVSDTEHELNPNLQNSATYMCNVDIQNSMSNDNATNSTMHINADISSDASGCFSPHRTLYDPDSTNNPDEFDLCCHLEDYF